MKKYDPNIYEGIHTIKVTIQQWDYVGHIIQEISGNCKGKDVLDFDFEYLDVDENLKTDCFLKYNEEDDYFSATLKNKKGDTMEIEGEALEFNDMIVKIEILDYVEE